MQGILNAPGSFGKKLFGWFVDIGICVCLTGHLIFLLLSIRLTD
jgi:hypothetical protein